MFFELTENTEPRVYYITGETVQELQDNVNKVLNELKTKQKNYCTETQECHLQTEIQKLQVCKKMMIQVIRAEFDIYEKRPKRSGRRRGEPAKSELLN